MTEWNDKGIKTNDGPVVEEAKKRLFTRALHRTLGSKNMDAMANMEPYDNGEELRRKSIHEATSGESFESKIHSNGHDYHTLSNKAQDKQNQLDRTRLLQAHLEGELSKCMKHKVGCIITDATGRIISTGRNGTPTATENCCDKFSDIKLLEQLRDTAMQFGAGEDHIQQLNDLYAEHHEWSKTHEIHAEINALMRADHDKRQCGTLYVNMQPCSDCAKAIAASGVKRVVFGIPYLRTDTAVSERIFKDAGVEYILIPNLLD